MSQLSLPGLEVAILLPSSFPCDYHSRLHSTEYPDLRHLHHLFHQKWPSTLLPSQPNHIHDSAHRSGIYKYDTLNDWMIINLTCNKVRRRHILNIDFWYMLYCKCLFDLTSHRQLARCSTLHVILNIISSYPWLNFIKNYIRTRITWQPSTKYSPPRRHLPRCHATYTSLPYYLLSLPISFHSINKYQDKKHYGDQVPTKVSVAVF